MRPNHLYPPFDKPAVRRALMGAIDQTELMIAAMGEDNSLWTVPMGFFPPTSPLANDAGMTALTSKRDDAKVKKDLEAAGYNGEKVVLMVGTDQPILKSLSDVARRYAQARRHEPRLSERPTGALSCSGAR